MRSIIVFLVFLTSPALAQTDLARIANSLERMSTSQIDVKREAQEIEDRSARQWQQLQQAQTMQQMQLAMQQLHQENTRLQIELLKANRATAQSKAWVDSFVKSLDSDDLTRATNQLNDFIQSLCRRKRTMSITVR